MNAHARTVQRRFGGEAGTWNGLYDQNPSGSIYVHNLHSRKQQALNLLEGVRGRILEIGCGAGNVILSLPNALETRTFGSDFSSFMLRQASENALEKGRNLPLAAADACNLPYRTDTFQAVLCLGVLDYIADYRRVLAECHRILAPGGQFVVSVPNITSPFVRLDDLGFSIKNRLTHSLPAGLRSFLKTRILGREDKPYFNHRKHRFNPQTVAVQLETAGFQLEQTRYHTYGFGLLNRAGFNVGLSRRIESRTRRSKTLERFGWTCIFSAIKPRRPSP